MVLSSSNSYSKSNLDFLQINTDKKNIINDINSIHGAVDENDLTSRFYWIHAKRIT